MFGEALKHSFNEEIYFAPTREVVENDNTDEVQHFIRRSSSATALTVNAGIAATATCYREANMVPASSTPPHLDWSLRPPPFFPEPNLNPNPDQVRNNNAQLRIPEAALQWQTLTTTPYRAQLFDLRFIREVDFYKP